MSAIDCTCTVGWASSQDFARELGIGGLLNVVDDGEPPTDPFCPIHGDQPVAGAAEGESDRG